jgi:hypothetical protein
MHWLGGRARALSVQIAGLSADPGSAPVELLRAAQAQLTARTAGGRAWCSLPADHGSENRSAKGMHQHPFEAPALPNKSSNAGHRSAVKKLIEKSTMASGSASADHTFSCGPAGHASPPRSATERRVSVRAAAVHNVPPGIGQRCNGRPRRSSQLACLHDYA